MTVPIWLTADLIKAAERVELDYHHDSEDLPRGVLRVTLPGDESEQPFVFRFRPRLTNGCHVKLNVELNDVVVGVNLDVEDLRDLIVEAEQRLFDDRNEGRTSEDARRHELLEAAEKAIRARATRPPGKSKRSK
jgi:hypothetical protein